VVNWKVSLAQAETNHAQFEAGRPAAQQQFLDQAAAVADALKKNFASYQSLKEAEVTKERDALQAVLADHKKFDDQHDTLRKAENDALRAWSIRQNDYERARAQVLAAVEAVKNAPAAMAKPCTECGKPHTAEETGEFVAHQTKRAKELSVTAATIQAEVTELQNAYAATKQATADYAATIPDVSATSARLTQVQQTLTACQQLKNLIQRQKTEHDRLKEEGQKALTAVNPHQSAIDLGRENVGKCEQAIDKLKGDAAELIKAVEVAASVAKVFSPGGVRAQILDTVTPFLNDRTSDYLSALSDGNISAVWSTLTTTAKGELREKFNIEVENATGAKSFGGLSGGEKRKVRLATMLALQDLVASRATKPLSLWVGDEIDDALDAAGLERLMTVLEQKAREKGTVLIISHESLSDWCDQIATVTKEGGQSTVSGALSA
jgi:DNA repair exonuclease SbcCD ATPase subunit